MSTIKTSVFVALCLSCAALVLAVSPATYAGSASGTASQHKEEPKAAPAAQTTPPVPIEKQKETYPLDVCVVTGNKLGGHGPAVDYVHEGRLVRFCCKGCIDTFKKDPAKYLAKLDEAAKAKTKNANTAPASSAPKDK